MKLTKGDYNKIQTLVGSEFGDEFTNLGYNSFEKYLKNQLSLFKKGKLSHDDAVFTIGALGYFINQAYEREYNNNEYGMSLLENHATLRGMISTIADGFDLDKGFVNAIVTCSLDDYEYEQLLDEPEEEEDFVKEENKPIASEKENVKKEVGTFDYEIEAKKAKKSIEKKYQEQYETKYAEVYDQKYIKDVVSKDLFLDNDFFEIINDQRGSMFENTKDEDDRFERLENIYKDGTIDWKDACDSESKICRKGTSSIYSNKDELDVGREQAAKRIAAYTEYKAAREELPWSEVFKHPFKAIGRVITTKRMEKELKNDFNLSSEMLQKIDDITSDNDNLGKIHYLDRNGSSLSAVASKEEIKSLASENQKKMEKELEDAKKESAKNFKENISNYFEKENEVIDTSPKIDPTDPLDLNRSVDSIKLDD